MLIKVVSFIRGSISIPPGTVVGVREGTFKWKLRKKDGGGVALMKMVSFMRDSIPLLCAQWVGVRTLNQNGNFKKGGGVGWGVTYQGGLFLHFFYI